MENENVIVETKSKDEKPKKPVAPAPKKEEQKAGAPLESAAEPKSKEKKGGKKKKIDEKTKKLLASTTLCKLVKKDFLVNHLKDYQSIVNKPEYVCKKCGRLANSKRSLCKPVLLK